jgi:hypothetical protein
MQNHLYKPQLACYNSIETKESLRETEGFLPQRTPQREKMPS